MKVYVGLVEENVDPKKVGRIKVRVLGVFDTLPVDSIPWAHPLKGLDGKSFSVPAVGKLVSVVFYNDDMYSPFYMDSQNYNINLVTRLNDMDDDDYKNFSALLYDHRTQIYSNNDELKLDYYYNNIVIDKGSVSIDLKNNDQKINIGDRDSASQQALFGNRWLEWFDKVVNELLNPLSLMGNMNAPVRKEKLDILLNEYKTIRETFLSDNVYLVDNGDVINQNEKKRDYETKTAVHDVNLKYNNKSIIDTDVNYNGGYIDEKGNYIKTEVRQDALKSKVVNDALTEFNKTKEADNTSLDDMDDNTSLNKINLMEEGKVDPDVDNSLYKIMSTKDEINEDGTPKISDDKKEDKKSEYDMLKDFKKYESDIESQNADRSSNVDSNIYYYKGSAYTSRSYSSPTFDPVIPGKNINVKIDEFNLNIIKGYTLGRHKWVDSDNPKNKIFIHHTNGNGVPLGVFHGWNSTNNLTCTPYVIGGYDVYGKTSKYDGQVYQFYPDHAWSWTSGVGGKKREKYIIGIELCNYGYVYRRDEKWITSYNSTLPDDQIYNLEDSPYPIKTYKGYTHYHKYTTKQIESLRKLLMYLIKKYNIKIDEGIYAKPNYWKYSSKAMDVSTSGIFHHAHTAKRGKWDLHPQPEIIDMLNGLKNL